MIPLAGTGRVIMVAPKLYGNALLHTGVEVSVREALQGTGVG